MSPATLRSVSGRPLAVLLLGCAIAACSGGCATRRPAAPLGEPGPGGRTLQGRRFTYTIRTVDDVDADERLPPVSLAEGSATYRGKARRVAKLSYAEAPLETFESLRSLRKSLPAQSDMVALGISADPESGRREEEDRNVEVTTYLVAASKEDDNDYHLILCHAPATSWQWCMTAEVSGLPADERAPAYEELDAARTQFLEFFGDEVPGDRYDVYDPPVAVRLAGSLFFDVNHGVDVVGPQHFKTRTSWEIHPVSLIEFEVEP